MQFSVMASQYIALVNDGIEKKEAMLSVYRLHWQEYGKDESQNVKPSTWFSTAKNIDCGIEVVLSCTTCGGKYILTSSITQEVNDRCIWCNHILPIHIFKNAKKGMFF